MTPDEFERERPPAGYGAKLTALFAAVRKNGVIAAARVVDQHPELVHARGAWREGAWVPVDAGEAGDTALHFAVFHGYAALAGALLDRGADLDALNHDGKSALELAAWEGG